MPATAKLTHINLVPLDEFEKSFVGKAMKWALSAGKSIVIVTEFVVILAFLSRFKLDRDLNDLNEVILQKQAVVESFIETETTMRKFQDKLKVVVGEESQSVGFSGIWGKLIGITPADTFYDSIELAQGKLVLKGVASSEQGFSILIDQLKKDPRYTQIQLSDVELSQSKGGVTFTITASGATKPIPGPAAGNTNQSEGL